MLISFHSKICKTANSCVLTCPHEQAQMRHKLRSGCVAAVSVFRSTANGCGASSLANKLKLEETYAKHMQQLALRASWTCLRSYHLGPDTRRKLSDNMALRASCVQVKRRKPPVASWCITLLQETHFLCYALPRLLMRAMCACVAMDGWMTRISRTFALHCIS
jgi:hypothetical protein